MTIYQIDPRHTGAQFRVRHMMIAYVTGQFSRVVGVVAFDPANLGASYIDAAIDAGSVSTNDPERDGHLKSADFLDVTRYQAITFRSKNIMSKGSGDYEVSGDLMIRAVTRPVTLQVLSVTPEIKDPAGLFRRGASAKTRIQRRDFGLTWNAVLESGGFVVGDDVEITIDVELIRKAESAALDDGGETAIPSRVTTSR